MKVLEQLRLLIRQLKWGRVETNLAMAGFSLLGLGPWLLDLPPVKAFLPQGWDVVTPTWILGVGLVAVSAAKLWRLTTRPLDIPTLDGPVVRGAAAFTPEDGEIFGRLGRQEELRRLRDWILDDQVPLVVVMGASGVGKTSLLRAGVQNLLDLEVAYWEAVANDPAEKLCQAIEAQLVNPTRGVVIIDQGEQLGKDHEVFEMLREQLEADPPYGMTWILAVRREYLPDWIEWSQTTLAENVRQRAQILPVVELSSDRAKEVFAILADEAQLVLREEVLDEVIRSISEGYRVSPVDLAIALQVLSRHPRYAEDPRHLLAIGGHSAMLTSYLENALDAYDEGARSEICRALLELIDLKHDRRKAEGATAETLERVAQPVSSQVFAHALERLALPAIRVLERLDNGHLRLVHERFIPAVRRVAGAVLSTTEDASRLLAQRQALWAREDESRRFLLTGRELRQIERELPQLYWGKDRGAKLRYLDRSRRWRVRLRGLMLAGATVGLLVSLLGIRWQEEQQTKARIVAWGMPEDLYEHLPNVRTLVLSTLQVSDLHWLRYAKALDRLTLDGERLSSLEGLPPRLSALDLNLADSSVDLVGLPKSLTDLSLSFKDSRLAHLEFLASIDEAAIPDLKILGYSQIASLQGIPSTVTHLDLHLGGSTIDSLAGIPNSVETLVLDLSLSRPTTLEGIPAKVSHLELDLRASHVRDLRGMPPNIEQLVLHLNQDSAEHLSKIPTSVKKLSLLGGPVSSLAGIPATVSELTLGDQPDLDFSEIPASVSNLTLDLGKMTLSRLDSIPSEVSALALDLGDSSIVSLDGIPQSVTVLDLTLGGSPLANLHGIPSKVSVLTLDLDDSSIASLDGIPQSVTVLNLTLGDSPVASLDGIPSEVSILTLDLRRSSITTLDSIPLSVEALSLSLGDSPMPDGLEIPSGVSALTLVSGELSALTFPQIPEGIQELTLDLRESGAFQPGSNVWTLDLSGSEVSGLPDIPKSVSELTLDLRGSSVNSLEGLPKNVILHLRL